MDKIDEIIQQLRQSLLNSKHLGSIECKIEIQSTEVVKALNEIRRALMEIKSNSNNMNLSSMGFRIEIEFAGKTGEEIRQEADIDFFNAIALFICLRKEIFHATSDKFIFVFSNVSERDNVEISFASYLYRILFYFSKDTSFSIKIDSKETDILGYRSSVSGGWGETGLPIIPINAENFETFGENVFTYIAKSEAKFVQDNKNFTIDSFLKAIENKEKILIKDINIKKSEILTTPWEKYEKREYSPIYLYCLVGVKELLKQCKDDFVLEYLQYMNVLTFLLFYAVYGGIYSPGSGRDTARKRKEILSVRDKFIELYQTCNDYSMGIMQLLENVLAHAKAGIFTFRSIGRSSTRYDKQVSSFYIIPQTRDTGWDFLQIYIADIAKEIVNDHKTDGEYKKLTEVFRINLDKRNKDEEGKKTKISNLSLRDIFWPTDRDEGTNIITDVHNDGYSPQAVDVIISSPNSAENSKYVTQGLRKTMSLTMLVRRYNDLDRVETVTNKDGESTQQTYFGARIDMTLLWVSTPTTKLGDNLFIFSSVDMKSVNTVLSYKNPNEINQILNHTKNGNCYKYVANLPDQGSDYKFVGTYDYEIFQSASINFRVVYLHHTLPSEGFTNNVTINNDIMDVEVSGPVLYAKYKSYIYTLNLT